MQALGYLSESRGDGPAAGLAEQNSNFLEWCERGGYRPAATFIDADLAGERGGFAQLIERLDEVEPGFVLVVVQSFRHLGAEPEQAAMALLQLRSRGARVESLDEGTLDEARLLALWDGIEGRDRGAPVREGMRRRAVRGQALGRTPYGYRVGSEGRLIPVPEEADVVRYIFRLYLDEGLGIRRIAQRLNDEDYRTRRGRPWSMVTIRDILRNRVYTGTYRRLGVSVPNNHEALITPAQHRQVEQGMQARRTAPGTSDPGDFLLAGLVWDGEDDARMSCVTRRQTWKRADGGPASAIYRYYQSAPPAGRSAGKRRSLRADEIEEQVVAHLRGAGARPGLARAGDPSAVAEETAEALAGAEARAKALARRLAGLLDEAGGSSRSTAKLSELAAPVLAAHEEVSTEIAALRARLAAQHSDEARRVHFERLSERMRDDWDGLPFEARRSLVRELVDRVIVREDSVETVLRA